MSNTEADYVRDARGDVVGDVVYWRTHQRSTRGMGGTRTFVDLDGGTTWLVVKSAAVRLNDWTIANCQPVRYSTSLRITGETAAAVSLPEISGALTPG